MNGASQRRRPQSTSQLRTPTLSTMPLTALLLPFVLLAVSALADFPSIDFAGLGAVNVAGSFEGVSIWTPETSSLNASNDYDGSTGSLVFRDQDGHLSKINSTNSGGRIQTVCQRAAAPNTVFVGGLFSQIAGLNASNVASYDPNSKAWSTLNGGVDGEVLALHCDDAHGFLYAGGSFSKPSNVSNVTDTSRYLGNLAMWNMTGSTWLPVPFGGVNGTVNEITQGVNASTLRFMGSFDTAFSSSLNGQSISGTNTSASPLSVAYAPVPLGQSEFQGGPSSANAAYANPAQILCPQGNDGEQNTYLFADNTTGRLTMRAFRNLPVSAIRLGNTFVEGRGTNLFNIISIPDNTQLELLYLDPVTQKNVTCTSCPLYHDASVPYQDFLITDNPANGLQNGVKVLTGIQFTATSWYGSGAGLHLMELLSNGAWAYAYQGYNRASCQSSVQGARGTQATVKSEGEWYHTFVSTTTPATMEPVLALSDEFSNIGAHQNDIVTWTPTVHYDGNYSVSVFVPGCSPGSQCNVRTEAQARVINNATVNTATIPWTRVSQTNAQDATVEIYNGPIQKTSETFRPSIQMSVPNDAPKPNGSSRFTVYADRVLLTLLNSNETHQYYVGKGFGVLEYDVFDTNVNNNSLAYGANPYLYNTTLIQTLLNVTFANATNATNAVNSTNTTTPSQQLQQYIQQIDANLYSGSETLPNSTMTPLDFFSVALQSAGVLRNESSVVYSVQDIANRTYVGGFFQSRNVTNTTGFANFVAYEAASGGQQVARLTGGGVNGVVNTLAAVDTFIFVGGAFTATTDNQTALPYIARYDNVANKWASLGLGLDGAVTKISIVDTRLFVTGEFTSVNGTANAGGVAVYNTQTNQWEGQSLPVLGAITTIVPVQNGTYLAGQIQSVGDIVAMAAINLSAPAQTGQYPNISVLNLALPGSTTTSSVPVPSGAQMAPNTRRSLSALPADPLLAPRHAISSTLLEAREAERRNDGLFSRLAARATSAMSARYQAPARTVSSLSKRADVMDPPSLASNGDNEILASAFWQQDSNTYWTILGGNFTTQSGIKNLGIYNPLAQQFEQFPAMPANTNLTVVRAVYVDKDTLYAGGDGGVLSFDLRASTWNSIPPLTAKAGTVLSISAIGHRPGSNTIIVAGTFTNAGGDASLPCVNVCQWDTSQKRWTSAGNGIDGQIAAIDFAGSKANTLVAAGSMTLNGVETAVAEYSFDSNAWTGIGSVGIGNGSVPGPATAVSVDSLNLNAIYVAGRSEAGTYPYFVKWDGTSYGDLSNGQLLTSTGVAQLTFVGLLQPHADNAVMENNRMLVMSGALNMRDYGNVSSALFDGAQWTPFVKSSKGSGQPGIVRAFTRGVETLTFANMHHLAVGLVILISIALGLAVVFLLVLLGLIWALLFRRRHKNGVVVPPSDSEDSLADVAAGEAGREGKGKQRPSSLLATLNKATENVMNEHKDVGYGDDGHDYRKLAGGAAVGGALAGRRGAEYAETQGHDTQGHGTLENSDETTGHGNMSSQYHSDGQTGQSGVSRYYSGDESSQPVVGAAGAAGIGAGAGAAAAAAAAGSGETDGIEAHARYAFEATHSSELGVEAGERIWVLDDQDEHWWLARNAQGKTGVLPASYVL